MLWWQLFSITYILRDTRGDEETANADGRADGESTNADGKADGKAISADGETDTGSADTTKSGNWYVCYWRST